MREIVKQKLFKDLSFDFGSAKTPTDKYSFLSKENRLRVSLIVYCALRALFQLDWDLVFA